MEKIQKCCIVVSDLALHKQVLFTIAKGLISPGDGLSRPLTTDDPPSFTLPPYVVGFCESCLTI